MASQKVDIRVSQENLFKTESSGYNRYSQQSTKPRRKLDIYKTQDLDELIGNGGDEFTIIIYVKDITNIRKKTKNEKLSKRDEDLVLKVYYFVGNIAIHASDEQLDKIHGSEIECWYDYANQRLEQLSTTKKWIQSGAIDKYETFFLGSCNMLIIKIKFLKIAFEKGFYQAFTKFMSALPSTIVACPGVTTNVFLAVNNSLACWLSAYGKGFVAMQKCLKMIQDTGLLTQLIRCSTMKWIDSHDKAVYYCFNMLMRCFVLINKKFKIGKPCGDMIREILSKKDKYKNLNPKVLIYLQNISKLAEITQDSNITKFHECGYCLCKNALMLCSRCKRIHYCSKECQKKHWKIHKPLCKETSMKFLKLIEINYNILKSFLRDNVANILEAVVQVVKKSGIKMSDIVLEVDYLVDEETGIVPALADPPQFFIKDVNGVPDWLNKFEGDLEPFFDLKTSKNRTENLEKDMLLCLARFPSSGILDALPFPFSQFSEFIPEELHMKGSPTYNVNTRT